MRLILFGVLDGIRLGCGSNRDLFVCMYVCMLLTSSSCSLFGKILGYAASMIYSDPA